MTLQTKERMVYITPLVCLLLAAGLVRYEYWHKAHMERELAMLEKEYTVLIKQLPDAPPPSPQDDHDEDEHSH